MKLNVRRRALLAGLAWSVSCGAAHADEPRRLVVPAQPMTTAILQLGAQAGVSIDARAAASCGRSRAIRGVHNIETALRLMLQGSGCAFRRIDDRTWVIVARPRPAPVAPSPPTELPPPMLDEVIVTATRRDLALADAPYALSALDGAAFDAAARRDTAALATRLAGLTVTNLGPGRNKLFVRGLADSPLTGQTQAMVGLYLDDTRLTYDAPDPDLRLVDLERVELLRGPQAALYGAGAMGGVLKLISRPPELDAWSAEVSAGLTFADDTAPGHSLDLVFNAPLVRERLALRTVFYEETLEGVIDDPALGLTNTGGIHRMGARATLLWRINDAWEARIGTVSQNLQIDDSQYGFEPGSPYERALTLREPSNNDFDGVSVTATGDFDWGRLKLASAFQIHDLDRRYDATPAAGRLGASGGPLAYDEADSIRAVAVEASIATPAGRRLDGLAGVYISQYSHDRTGAILDVDPDVRLYEAVKTDKTQDIAVFGEVAWTPDDRLKLTLGGRYFNVLIESSTLQTGRTSEAFEGEHRDDDFSLKAVLEYAVDDTLLTYVQASQGYRVGGFNGGALIDQPYGEPGVGPQPYREFQPDSLDNFEAGVRWRAFDDRLALRLAAFMVDWSAIQSDRVSPDGLPFTANIGSASNSGAELEGVWRDGPWRLDFNLMANDARLDAAEDSYPLAVDGGLPGVPNVLGAISARREGGFRGLKGWASGSIGYVGQSTQQLTPDTVTEMGDYVTSEIAARIELGAWAATIRIDNLFGGDGDTFGYGNPFLVGRKTVVTPQRPRNLSLSLTRAF